MDRVLSDSSKVAFSSSRDTSTRIASHRDRPADALNLYQRYSYDYIDFNGFVSNEHNFYVAPFVISGIEKCVDMDAASTCDTWVDTAIFIAALIPVYITFGAELAVRYVLFPIGNLGIYGFNAGLKTCDKACEIGRWAANYFCCKGAANETDEQISSGE